MHNILVVEDYPDNMALIEEILEDEGYTVLTAVNAEVGLDVLANNQVDLILMDVSLPKMSGLDATRLIRKNPAYTNLPVIALTAHAMKADELAAKDAGCSAYLTKPIDEERVLSVIAKLLNNELSEEGVE